MGTRSKRMVDRGEKQAGLTFDLGKPATKKETENALKFLRRLKKEVKESKPIA